MTVTTVSLKEICSRWSPRMSATSSNAAERSSARHAATVGARRKDVRRAIRTFSSAISRGFASSAVTAPCAVQRFSRRRRAFPSSGFRGRLTTMSGVQTIRSAVTRRQIRSSTRSTSSAIRHLHTAASLSSRSWGATAVGSRWSQASPAGQSTSSYRRKSTICMPSARI